MWYCKKHTSSKLYKTIRQVINIKKIIYAMTAILTAVSMASCTKCPKATNIRSDRECSKTESTTSSISQSSSLVAQTTIGVTISEDIKKMKKIITTTAMTESKKITESTMTSSMIETETEVKFTETTSTETEPVVYEYKTEPLSGYWDGTYYTAVALGHTSPPCGASGNQLISGYSVASDYFDYGTLLYIESEYMNGTFRVDDCGVGNYNTIDFYFYDNSEVPYDLSQAGRVPITITVIN